MLCLKQKDTLSPGHLFLYEPYKNILRNFLELATTKEAKDFDPVAKVYHGILSAPPEIRDYYEGLLGITSYYQAILKILIYRPSIIFVIYSSILHYAKVLEFLCLKLCDPVQQ